MASGGKAVVQWAGGEAAATGLTIGLAAVGVTSVFVPAVAVIVLIGHVIVGGVTRIVKKKLKVRADQREHLEQLRLTETKPADHFTLIINGIGAEEGQFSAFVSPVDNEEYMSVSVGHLRGISKLISGTGKCNVRDMGGFTEGAGAPFSVRLSMPDLLALMRQSWTYEKFCQTKCKTMTVVVLKAQGGNTKLRVAWENSGSIDYTKAFVYTEREWKKTRYSGKTKTMPESIADVDMALEKMLVFE